MTSTRQSEHAELLSRLELFRGLDRVTLAKLSAHLEPLAITQGETLFNQGDAADGLYVVSRGSFGVYAADADSQEVRLSICHRGEAFGEIALLSGDVRSATVRAEEDGEVLRLDKSRFMSLVRADPSVGLAISAGLIRLVRQADAARLGTVEPVFREPLPITGREERARTWKPDRKIVALGLAALILVGGWFAPAPEGLSLSGWHALISLLAVVPILAVEALPDGAAALLLVTIWVVGGVVPARVATGGFASTAFILSVSVFTVGAAVAASGLLYRFSLLAVARAGSFAGQMATLGISGLILGAAVPNATGRMSLVASGIAELAEAVGYAPKSRAAAGLAMAAMAGFGVMAAPFVTSSTTALVALALLPESNRAALNWVEWAIRALPMHVLLLGGLLAFVTWRYSPALEMGGSRKRDALSLQRSILGAPTRNERIAGVVTVGLLVGFATQPLHGIDPAWVGTIAFVVLAACSVLTVDTLRQVNWSTVLLLGVLSGMGEVFAFAKLDMWVAGLVVGAVGGLARAPVLFVGVLAVLCLLLNLVLRWQAAVPLVIIALSPIARGAGIDPWVVAIVALTACNMFFLPYQSTIYLALYSGTGGRLFTHEQARPVAIASAVLTVVGLLVSVPYWQLLGLP